MKQQYEPLTDDELDLLAEMLLAVIPNWWDIKDNEMILLKLSRS